MERSIEPIRPLSPRSRWEAPSAPDEVEERRRRERRERERLARERAAARRAAGEEPLDGDGGAGRTPRTDAGEGPHIDVRA